MAIRQLAGFVFDMDGLMYDTERIIMNAWDKTGKEMGYGPLGFHLFSTLGMSRSGRKEYFQKTLGMDFPYDEFQERYAEETYRQTETCIPVKPGLYELLDYLKQEHYVLAVATSSSRESALRKLKNSHLEQGYFDVIICGDMVKRAKPDPEIYQIACQKLQKPPSQLVALEDSENGLKSALSAGMGAIMIPDLIRDYPDIEPFLDGKFNRLDELISFIPEHYIKI
ncbi:MAG: HAD family phosphatase [Lachnospiraceae bacterium]|nr:HAD family phosphatase [Lachnospiraceae bacterium]